MDRFTKELLRKILPKDNTGRVRYTDHITGGGERLFKKIEALNLEGMVMKRKDSVYAFARCRDWLKVYADEETDFPLS